MAYSRYGFTPRTGKDNDPRPMQYTAVGGTGWAITCLACHGGKVAGRAMPGLPNSNFAMQTLFDDVRALKLVTGQIGKREVFGSFFPLGGSNGTTNAVMFGVVLMAYRDANLVLHKSRPLPKMVHHDMDAPPWWHFKRKKMIYIDGFAEKGHRGLMQFMLVPQNGPEKFRSWENDFRNVFAYISSIEPPKYPYAIDEKLAERGRTAFHRLCAECHGTYGPGGSYPERRVPIDEVRTDRVRLDALSPAHRTAYGESWFANFGKLANVAEPDGYVAPPLDGIWASAPYLHNGSVPTLWHMLHPSERPIVWKRRADTYDADRVGPQIETFSELPDDVQAGWQRRQYFDTRAFGKSNAGHDFPSALTEEEKRAVLEYLKTL